MLDDWLDSFEIVDDVHKRELMRVLAIAIARTGDPSDETRERLVELLDPMFPTDDFDTDWQLLQLLVALEAPLLPERALDLIQSDPDPAHQLAFAMAIRTNSDDWDDESLAGLFEWCDYASGLHGGHSLIGFVAAAREDVVRSVDPELLVGQQVSGGAGSATIPVDPEEELGRMPEMVRAWTVAEIAPLLSGLDDPRDLQRGARVFRATLCVQCHRFGGDGGSTGPDLTGVAGRYSREDMLRTLIEPSHSISDQYEQSAVFLREGGRVVGRVVGMTDSELEVNTNPFGRSIISIPRAEIDRVEPLETSAMPDHLLDVLRVEEILDLMAYLESGRATTPE
jgi:putative heme-binding domain-containing protein